MQDLVGIAEGGAFTVGKAEGQLADRGHGTDRVVPVSGNGQDGRVAGGGILAAAGQSVRVLEVGMIHAEVPCLCVHGTGEGFLTPGVIPCKAVGDIVAAAHQQHGQQVGFPVDLVCPDIDLCGFDPGVTHGDLDLGVETSPVKYNEGGQQFLDAGDWAPRVRIPGMQDVPVAGVKDNDRFPGNSGRWRLGPVRGGGFFRDPGDCVDHAVTRALGLSLQHDRQCCRADDDHMQQGQGEGRALALPAITQGILWTGQVLHWLFLAELIFMVRRELGVAPRSMARW